jgi:replicative DNA helicase
MIPTGFCDLDTMLGGGLRRGTLTVIAARPSFGKSALTTQIAVNMAKAGKKVLVFPIEMSANSVVSRIMASESLIEPVLLRKGIADWSRVRQSVSKLNESHLWLEDDAGLTSQKAIAVARELSARLGGLDLVVVDYIQRFSDIPTDNRNQWLGKVTKSFTVLARQVECPVILVSQVNRGVETSSEKRPTLASLRDCLPGNATIIDANTGERHSIKEIADGWVSPSVFGIDEDMKLAKRPIAAIWPVGKKMVYRVETETGKILRCTNGHRLYTLHGWIELKNLHLGDSVGLPRQLPVSKNDWNGINPNRAELLGWLLGDGHVGSTAELTVAKFEETALANDLCEREFGFRGQVKPDKTAWRICFNVPNARSQPNPFMEWLRSIKMVGLSGQNKYTPEIVFMSSDETIRAYLRGLFHADGSLPSDPNKITVKFINISETLVREVQHLLLRLGILASVHSSKTNHAGYRTKAGKIWTVSICGREQAEEFVNTIGFRLWKQCEAESLMASLPVRAGFASGRDRLPVEIGNYLKAVKEFKHQSWNDIGYRVQNRKPSRDTILGLGADWQDPYLLALAQSDLTWERISRIEPEGEEETYDLTVEGTHNFVVDDFLTHNSGEIEQDADIVMMLYREWMYNKNADPHLAELIIAKQRDGPTGTVKLYWHDTAVRFDNLSTQY